MPESAAGPDSPLRGRAGFAAARQGRIRRCTAGPESAAARRGRPGRVRASRRGVLRRGVGGAGREVLRAAAGEQGRRVEHGGDQMVQMVHGRRRLRLGAVDDRSMTVKRTAPVGVSGFATCSRRRDRTRSAEHPVATAAPCHPRRRRRWARRRRSPRGPRGPRVPSGPRARRRIAPGTGTRDAAEGDPDPRCARVARARRLGVVRVEEGLCLAQIGPVGEQVVYCYLRRTVESFPAPAGPGATVRGTCRAQDTRVSVRPVVAAGPGRPWALQLPVQQ